MSFRYFLLPAGWLMLALAGCAAKVCDQYPDLCNGSGGAGGTSTQSTSSSSGTTSSSSLSTECDPLSLAAGASLDATCGIFVDPGKTDGDGSQGSPFGTLSDALKKNPKALPIYVCSTGSGLVEPVELSASEQIVGAVTCEGWKPSKTKTAWTASANEIPLTLKGTSDALVQGFAIASAGATGFDAKTLEGASSIAVFASGGSATLVDVDAVSGSGASGGDGLDQTDQAPGRQSDATSFDGHAGGGCNLTGGPAQDYATCPAGGGTTEGGKGGDGGNAAGSGATPGTPNPGLGAPQGTAGLGDTGVGVWSCGANLGNGEFGHDGPAGTGGPGGTGAATLDASGYHGAPGTSGTVGTIGQGGGGGGGLRKGACTTTGPSGGSGGAGGCGGFGGQGGGAGGASIALVSINATLTLTSVTLDAGSGGTGGAGGDGQPGGNGGVGAVGGGSACQGGSGGKGGDGGGGGGGKGGASIGLASTGTAPVIDDASITVSASPALGGAAGGGNVPGFAGDNGDADAKKKF